MTGFLFGTAPAPIESDTEILATGTITPRPLNARFGELSYNVKDFGAIGDGTYHYLNERYGSLAAAQVDYPFATNITTETIDKCAIQKAASEWAALQNGGRTGQNRGHVFFPPGIYVTDGPVTTWGFVYPGALTLTPGSPTVWHKTAHNLVVGQRVIIGTAGGTYPTGYHENPSGTVYYVMSDGLDANNFQLSSSASGLVHNASDIGTGAHYLANWMGGGGKFTASVGTVLIQANFDGFIFDNDSIEAVAVEGLVEGINFKNTHPNGGCVRAFQDSHKTYSFCCFYGHFGAVFQGEDPDECGIDTKIDHCYFQGNGSEGAFDTYGLGLVIGPNTKVDNCTFFSHDTGLMMGGAQIAVRSCRFETNNHAMRVGRYPRFNSAYEEPHSHIGSIVEGISFESNVVDMKITAATGLVIRDIFSQLNVTVPSPAQPIPHLGECSLWFISATDIVVEKWLCTGVGAPTYGGIYFASDMVGNARHITFIDCVNNSAGAGGAGFVNTSTAGNAGMETIRCKGGGITQITCTLAQLNAYGATGYAAPGTKRWCSNASNATGTIGTTAWGTAIATGTGSNIVPVWWDGTVWRLGN